MENLQQKTCTVHGQGELTLLNVHNIQGYLHIQCNCDRNINDIVHRSRKTIEKPVGSYKTLLPKVNPSKKNKFEGMTSNIKTHYNYRTKTELYSQNPTHSQGNRRENPEINPCT
jgi:hypothetical protein